jgi:hypothetical protein
MLPLTGTISGATPVGPEKIRAVTSSVPLPAATTFGPSCKSVTTYAACTGVAIQPISIAAQMPIHLNDVMSPAPRSAPGVHCTSKRRDKSNLSASTFGNGGDQRRPAIPLADKQLAQRHSGAAAEGYHDRHQARRRRGYHEAPCFRPGFRPVN